MKSYPLKVHDRVGLMAYQTVLPRKTVYVGLTITVGMTQVTEIGQEIVNALAAYAPTKNLTMFQVAGPKNPLNGFRAALGKLNDGDAILVMAERGGQPDPIVKALNIQAEQSSLPQQYTLNEQSPLIQGMIREFLAAEGDDPVKRGMAPKPLAA